MLTDSDRPKTAEIIQQHLLDIRPGDLDRDGDVDVADMMQVMEGWPSGQTGLSDLMALADNFGHKSRPLLLDGMDHIPADQRPADLGLTRIRTTGAGWQNYRAGGNWQERWPTVEEVRKYSKLAADRGYRIFMFDIEEGYGQHDEAGWRECLNRTAELYQVAAEAGIGVGQFGQFPWPARYNSTRLDNETANGLAMEIVMPHCQFIARGYYFGEDAALTIERLVNDAEFINGWIDRPFVPYINPTYWYRALGARRRAWHGPAPLMDWIEMIQTAKAYGDATVLWGDAPQFQWQAPDGAYMAGTWFPLMIAMHLWGLRSRPAWFRPQTLTEQGESE